MGGRVAAVVAAEAAVVTRRMTRGTAVGTTQPRTAQKSGWNIQVPVFLFTNIHLRDCSARLNLSKSGVRSGKAESLVGTCKCEMWLINTFFKLYFFIIEPL